MSRENSFEHRAFKAKDSNQENHEVRDKSEFIMRAIEHGEFIDSGKQGVVLKVDLERGYNDENGVSREGEAAAKLLKIYDPENARRESELHERAFALISKAGEEDIAKIPQMYDLVDVTTDSERVTNLLKRKGSQAVRENISVLVMEFVQGKTFARYIYEQVVKRHHKLVHLKDVAQELSMGEIQDNIASALEFNMPGGKHSDPGLKHFEREKVFGENIKKLIEYLAKTDFVLPENILGKVKKTVNILHENNFFHRDLHEKNVMIKEGVGGEIEEVFLIDFGLSAIDTDKDKNHNPYLNPLTGEQYMVDETLYTRYASLTFPEHIRKTAEKQNTKRKLNDLGSRILKRHPSIFENIKKDTITSVSDIDAASRQIARDVTGKTVGDLSSEVQAFTAIELCRQKNISLVDYFEFVSSQSEYKSKTPFLRMIQDVIILESG